MEVAEAATIRFDDEVSEESRHRIVTAVATRNAPCVSMVVVCGRGIGRTVFVGRDSWIAEFRKEIEQLTAGQRDA